MPPGKASAYAGSENVATIPDSTGTTEPSSPPPAATSAAPDQATQVLDAIRLAACQPYVGGFFNFELRDETDLGGWQSGLLHPDWSAKPAFTAYLQTLAAARAGTISCAAK